MASLQALACSMAARDRLRCFYHGNLDDHFSKSLTNSRRQLQHARRPGGTWPRCFRLHDARPAPWLCVCVCASVCVCVFGCTTRGRLSIKTLCVYVCVSVSLSLSLSLSLSFSLAVELTTRSRQHCVSETAWDCSACVYDTAHHSETSDTSATTI